MIDVTWSCSRWGARRLALGVVLAGGAGCPADPVFHPSEVTDTTVAPDTAVAADTEADGADVPPCEPTCPSDMSVGACGDDGCGGMCFCPAASLCAVPDGLCGCLVGCEVTIATDLIGPVAAAVDGRGRPLVAAFQDPFPHQHDLVLGTIEGVFVVPLDTVREAVGNPFDVALALTASGAPIVIFTEDQGGASRPSWARRAGSAWVVSSFLEIADGARLSLERSRQGQVFAAVVDREKYEARFARLDGTILPAWEEVATLPSVGGEFTGVPMILPLDWTLDDRDRPHVVYSCCGPNSELRYTHWVGDAWSSDSLGIQPRISASSRRSAVIGLDRDAHPHLVHQSADGGAPLIVDHSWGGSEWGSDEVARGDEGAELGQTLMLVEDGRGDFHLVYTSTGRLIYRKYEAGRWSDPIGAAGLYDDTRGVDLTVDAANTPHVIYGDAAGQAIWWTPPEAP